MRIIWICFVFAQENYIEGRFEKFKSRFIMSFPIIDKCRDAYPQHQALLDTFASYYTRKYPPP